MPHIRTSKAGTVADINFCAYTMADGQMMKRGEWFCIYICMYGLHTGPVQ